jgi:hypothetical protein
VYEEPSERVRRRRERALALHETEARSKAEAEAEAESEAEAEAEAEAEVEVETDTGSGGLSGAGGANPNPNPNAAGWLGQAGTSASTWVGDGWRALCNAAKGRFGAGSLGTVRLLTGARAGAASAAAASAAEQQLEPAALGHVHAQRDAEEQQCDGDGGGDEQQERVERQQSRTEPDSTAGHVELGRVDEQVLQDGEWQQQQQLVRGGGGDDEEDEDEEQPASGAEERGHAEEADAEAGALTWQELFSGWGGIMRRGVGALVGGLGRIRGLVGVGEAGGTGGTEGEADAFGGREGLVHRFAAAWVRVRAAFGDG